MNLTDYYNSHISSITKDIKKIKFKRNIITLFKVSVFALIVWIFYLMIADFYMYQIAVAAILIFIFVLLSKIDSKVEEAKNIAVALKNCCKQEMDYINGDVSTLATGKEYADQTHSYTHDLDIFGDESIFQSLNRTVTINGADKLAEYLTTPCKDRKEIESRQEAVQELKKQIEWSRMFRATGKVHPTEKSEHKIIDTWQKEPSFFKGRMPVYFIYSSNVVTIGCLILSLFDIIPIQITIFMFMSQLTLSILFMKRLMKKHSSLDRFIKAVSNYFYLVKKVNEVTFESDRLKELNNKLFSENNALEAFSSLSKILSSLDNQYNMLVLILLNGLYTRSLHNMIALDKWKDKYADYVNEWIAAISEFDALISMSNYSFNHPSFTTPQIDTSVVLSGKEMCHPLLKEGVTNDFLVKELHHLFIVTGANMAGKSTFLRSVGVNFVLALSGNVVNSSNFKFTPMDIFTSMRTTDNLSKGTSYFHAELLRLKELTNKAEQGEPVFIILDEMLKGTNSEDKLNGSIKFLKRLLHLPVCGLVATHDLALGELSDTYKDNFHNVCFEINHKGDDIIYDYKLKSGVSQNMNASILLQQMGLI